MPRVEVVDSTGRNVVSIAEVFHAVNAEIDVPLVSKTLSG